VVLLVLVLLLAEKLLLFQPTEDTGDTGDCMG